jgi:hypothetical protein
LLAQGWSDRSLSSDIENLDFSRLYNCTCALSMKSGRLQNPAYAGLLLLNWRLLASKRIDYLIFLKDLDRLRFKREKNSDMIIHILFILP